MGNDSHPATIRTQNTDEDPETQWAIAMSMQTKYSAAREFFTGKLTQQTKGIEFKNNQSQDAFVEETVNKIMPKFRLKNPKNYAHTEFWENSQKWVKRKIANKKAKPATGAGLGTDPTSLNSRRLVPSIDGQSNLGITAVAGMVLGALLGITLLKRCLRKKVRNNHESERVKTRV